MPQGVRRWAVASSQNMADSHRVMDAHREPLQTHTPGFRVVSGSDNNSLPRLPTPMASSSSGHRAESLCPALQRPHPATPLLVSARSGQSSKSPAQAPQGIRPLPPPACYLSSSPPQALTPGTGSGNLKVLGDQSHTQVRAPHFPALRDLGSSQVVVRRSWSPGFWS